MSYSISYHKGFPLESTSIVLNEDFGSFDNWLDDFWACCLRTQGKVVLGMNLKDGQLYNYVINASDVGGLADVHPLLVFETFDRTCAFTRGTDKLDYLEMFFNNVNWEVVEERLHSFL